MAKKSSSQEDKIIICKICMKEIPLSEAINAEAVDYVAHFCGNECYTKWKKKSEKAGSQSGAAKKR